MAAVGAPTPFRRAAQLLRAVITAAHDDDFAIQGSINAGYDYDCHSFDRFYAEYEQATARATEMKRAFAAEYERERELGLGPTPAGGRY